MNKKEITKKLKEVKIKMKTVKKDDYEEYLKLRDERLKLEADLAELKKRYYAQAEQSAKIKIRKTADHKKFIYGGLIVKYLGFINEEELEKKLQTIANQNINFNEKADEDISQYLVGIENN